MNLSESFPAGDVALPGVSGDMAQVTATGEVPTLGTEGTVGDVSLSVPSVTGKLDVPSVTGDVDVRMPSVDVEGSGSVEPKKSGGGILGGLLGLVGGGSKPNVEVSFDGSLGRAIIFCRLFVVPISLAPFFFFFLPTAWHM